MTTPRSLRIAIVFRARDALAASRRPEDAVAAAHAAFEAAWADARPAVGDLACRDGCTACCHQRVAILPAEAIAIAAHMSASFNASIQADLQARIVAAVDAPAGGPCPFLDDAGLCRIYPVRPLRCRGVHSRRAAVCAKWTDPAAAQPDTTPGTAFPPEPLALADAALAGLGQALMEAGMAVDSVDLADTLAGLQAEAAANRPPPGSNPMESPEKTLYSLP